MFFYISFLRPPPTQVSPYEQILTTPQISNDLRTELYKSPQDIYYSWAPYPQTHYQSSTSSATSLRTTNPVKLTTYRSNSSFKEIPVPAPPGVREGQQWQLILSSSAPNIPTIPNYVIHLQQPDIGKNPFPVISMPILFSGRSSKGSIKKQERIERIYLLSGTVVNNPTSSEKEYTEGRAACGLKITEQTSFDLDKKIWDSGIGLGSWLLDFRNSGPTQLNGPLEHLWNTLFSVEPRHMVELGAGTGLVSLTIASLRSWGGTSHCQDDRIIATDLASAIPLLRHNISSNLSLYPHNPPEADVLDWDDEDLPDSVKALGNIDVILMSDVTYNTTSFPALLATLSKILTRSEKPPVILLGYKERDEAERDLWSMIETIGVRLEKIGLRRGFTEPAIEIWTGGLISSASISTVSNRVI